MQHCDQLIEGLEGADYLAAVRELLATGSVATGPGERPSFQKQADAVLLDVPSSLPSLAELCNRLGVRSSVQVAREDGSLENPREPALQLAFRGSSEEQFLFEMLGAKGVLENRTKKPEQDDPLSRAVVVARLAPAYL